MKFCHIAFTMRCLEAGESPLLSLLCQWYLFILLKSNLVWASTKIQQLRRQLYLNKTCLLTLHSFGKSLRVFRFYVGVFYSPLKKCLSLLKGGEKITFFTCGNFFFPSFVTWISSSSPNRSLSLSQSRLGLITLGYSSVHPHPQDGLKSSLMSPTVAKGPDSLLRIGKGPHIYYYNLIIIIIYYFFSSVVN